ncbi:MAG: hypothetical protein JW808_00650, partial [Victivallales bacterium]|nr:hypothetical protein [Victivallales bacterium]
MPCLRPNPLGGKLFWREFHAGAVGTDHTVCPLPQRRGLASKMASRAATGSFEIGSIVSK